MFEYKIGLALVKSIDESDKGLDERKDFIMSQVQIFNEKSSRSVINPKHIGTGNDEEDNIQLTRSTLVLTLYAQEEITTPGKAIRLLSQLLITAEDPDNLSDLLLEKKLFRSFKVATAPGSDSSDKIIDIAAVSDSELIKALVDYVCNQQDFSAQKRNVIDQMKRLAIESGLINAI